MAVSVVGALDVAPSVVTITVHITLNGDELPPEASRLLSDLEALAASRAGQQIQRTAPLPRTPSAGSTGRNLRLVEQPAAAPAPHAEEPAADAEADPKVRRIGRATPDAPSLYLCTGSRLVLQDGAPVALTRREYDLFLFLCEHPRRVFSRAQLLRQVWGYDMVGTERTVDVHVRRLRVKLGDAARIIATVRGVGYRLDDDAAVQVVVRED
ncbi:winged helix-turn-helix transcriptional regulator [Dactylosporangium vinaceum]|uniref:Winged helix-turn-helix domain-containing protein n=1 Tax=Dactylosporangium vinaceum TaxID=53362 RepID=A0ABV5MGL7_9ACTN|nr:winged helix-turn-helix domain-containing protein [Dactylosporangium vinaceum]UAB95049.1 winged helix-turn-helix transcriptional regulator [Dactylosporangium vinaceum]